MVPGGRKSTSAESVVVLPAIGASDASITLLRLATTAHRVAIRRASRLPLSTISTADIGRGGAQWYPHQPSGKRAYQDARESAIVRPR